MAAGGMAAGGMAAGGMAAGDLTDAEWELVGPLRPPARGRPGRPGHANRPILDGILWRAREGARWRAVPGRYGKWNTVWRRFARWRGLGWACSRRSSPLSPAAARPRSACRSSTAPSSAPTSTPPAPRGAARPSAGPLPGRVLDQAAPALRRARAAVGPRPRARRGARDPRLRGPGRGSRPGHALPDRRHGLRRRLAAAGAAAARRLAGDPAQPGPQGADRARPRA